jgi:hypothetical protein
MGEDKYKRKEAGSLLRPLMRTKRLKIALSDAAPQIYALLHTRNTALLHLNYTTNLPDPPSPASHQYWLHVPTGTIYFAEAEISGKPMKIPIKLMEFAVFWITS